MTSRFAMSTHEEIKIKEELGEASHDTNANTKKSTQTWLNVYKAWATWRGKKITLEEYVPSELNEVLSTFYCEVRKSDGRDYEPDCLRVMQSSLYRYLTEKKYPKSIVSDAEFKNSQDVLEGKIRRLRIEGKGKKPTSVKVLTQEVEERLWQTSKLGHHSPITLIHTMWFNNTKYFGLRGRENHVALTMDNFKRKIDENGIRYIELSELPSTHGQQTLHYNTRCLSAKMVATGGTRCPVALFEFYVSKRPSEIRNSGRFYLSPRHNIGDNNVEWFRQCPMGKNTLSRMLKNILDPESLNKSINNPTNGNTSETFMHRISTPRESNGPLIERLHVGEDSEYAIIKIPRQSRSTYSKPNCSQLDSSPSIISTPPNFQHNINSPVIDYESDDGFQTPTMSDIGCRMMSSQLPTMTNVFSLSSQMSGASTATASSSSCHSPKSFQRPFSPERPESSRQSGEKTSSSRDNIFTHIDEKGSINVFYNCNVTFVQSEPVPKGRKRKFYDSGNSTPEQ